jgi:hypothetical protein
VAQTFDMIKVWSYEIDVHEFDIKVQQF